VDQTRRDFLKTCCALGAAGALVSLGVSCSKSSNPTQPSAQGCPFTVDNQGRVVLDLTECTALSGDNSSTQLVGTSFGRPILVTHTTGQIYYALDSRCTHQSCTVSPTTPTLNCPCHGSRYALDGTVVQGPAPRRLPELALAKNGNLLTITVS
jgi:Rieske Fe-S protein